MKRWKPVLRALVNAQGGKCASCGKPFPPQGDLTENDQAWPSIDHVVARAAGGANNLGNMLAMHRGCNSAKGDRAATGCELIWHEMVRARLDMSPHDHAIYATYSTMPTRRATIADVWPTKEQRA